MAVKTKTFDCVDMKNRVQKKLEKEYERRKGEFTSYADFIEKKAVTSDWAKRMRGKLHA